MLTCSCTDLGFLLFLLFGSPAMRKGVGHRVVSNEGLPILGEKREGTSPQRLSVQKPSTLIGLFGEHGLKLNPTSDARADLTS